MPYTVAVSFDRFLEKISISGDQQTLGATRRDTIVSLLKNHFTILEAFATGSIPKRTAIKGSDLDVMVALHYGKHIKDKTPSAVLKAVREALGQYRTGARRNGQAVTLYYDTWPNVDIVPVSRSVDNSGAITHFNVPDENRGIWIESKPKTHSKNVAARVSSYGPEFRRIIRMLKWWNQNHSSYLNSYHIEALALRALDGTFDNYSWQILRFFEQAIEFVASSLWYEGNQVDDYLTYSDRAEAITRLKTAKGKALLAWHSTYGQNNNDKAAIEYWCQVFGDGFPKYG